MRPPPGSPQSLPRPQFFCAWFQDGPCVPHACDSLQTVPPPSASSFPCSSPVLKHLETSAIHSKPVTSTKAPATCSRSHDSAHLGVEQDSRCPSLLASARHQLNTPISCLPGRCWCSGPALWLGDCSWQEPLIPTGSREVEPSLELTG